MLNQRYQFDAKSIVPLNKLQQEVRNQIDCKIKEHIYEIETVTCAVCDSDEYVPLSEKERYGLFMQVVACKNCGFVYSRKRMNQESFNEFYNLEYRKLYVGERKPSVAFFKAQHAQGKKIYDFLDENKLLPENLEDYKVLEIGCGAGGILQYFKERGCNVEGLDLGKEYIEYGRRYHNLNLKVGALEGYVASNRLPNLVIYSHVLEHILDLDKELANIKRVTSDNGLVYVEVPGLRNLHNSYCKDLLLYLQNAHVSHFTKVSLSNLFNNSCFEDVTVTEEIRGVFKKAGEGHHSEIVPEEDIVDYLAAVEKNRRSIFPDKYLLSCRVKKYVKVILVTIGLFNLIKNAICLISRTIRSE